MPIYEYKCPQCNDDFELLVRSHESPACPECGSDQLEKLLSVPAAHSQGSSELPMCDPSPGSCGRPQCGMGGCQMGM